MTAGRVTQKIRGASGPADEAPQLVLAGLGQARDSRVPLDDEREAAKLQQRALGPVVAGADELGEAVNPTREPRGLGVGEPRGEAGEIGVSAGL
jgi:hypothetical protein